MAAILTKPGSHCDRSVLAHSAWTSFSATPTPARFLSGIGAIVAARVDDRQGARQLGVRLVMVGDDQIDAEVAGPPGRFRAANAAVDRHDQLHALAVQPFDGGGLQAVAVGQPFGNEVADVGAQQLQRAAKDDGRGDAVDVVIAVNGDPLPSGNRGQQPPDRAVHVGEQKRVQQLIEFRAQKPRGRIRIGEATDGEEPGGDGRQPEVARQLLDVRCLERSIIPERLDHVRHR